VFRSHPNLRQQLVEPFMFFRDFFAALFLERRHHEWTVGEGRVAKIELVLAEIILRVLTQIHASIDSVVMGRSRITRMVITNLSVVITNDHHGQSVSVLSSFVVRSVLHLRFKHKWKQGSASDSNHVRKSSLLHNLLRKFLSFLFVWPSVVSRTKLQNRSHDSVPINVRGSLTNAECLPLVLTVGSRTFSADVFQGNHQVMDDRCLWSSCFLVADCREFFVIFYLSKDPIEGRFGHATFLQELIWSQPRQCRCGLFNRFWRGKVVGEAVGSAFSISGGMKQVTFSFAMFDYGSQSCVFGFLDAVVVFVCTRTVKPMLQTVIHKTVQMP